MKGSSKIRSAGYDVVIGKNAFASLDSFLKKKKYSRIFILCDENTFRFCLPALIHGCECLQESELLEIESGEENKNMGICIDLFKALTDGGADRHSLLVNLGGGVIGDMGGFIASVYKRGFEFINVPTTLLAMADASVGGKTGIDFEGLKNHIGTITQPAGVFVYPEFLATLPQRQFLSGFAEIIKAGLIADNKLFGSISRIKNLNHQRAGALLHEAISIKNSIVKKDPLEKNFRKGLNFGHTIGHALESFSFGTGNPLLHGEAVALGMLAEAKISARLGLLEKDELSDISKTVRKFFAHIIPPKAPADVLTGLMKQDKKNRGQVINFSLLQGIGKFRINCEAPEEIVLETLEELF